MDINTKVQIPSSVFIQEVDNEVIILDTITEEYFSINEVGKDIWDLISKNQSLKAIKEELSLVYEIDENQLEVDIINFIKALNEKGLINID
jgi:hypothetical protein